MNRKIDNASPKGWSWKSVLYLAVEFTRIHMGEQAAEENTTLMGMNILLIAS